MTHSIHENRYRQRFPHRHTVFPVIHAESTEQTLRNARIALDAGADGVFLINHAMTDEALLDLHEVVADTYPGLWIGLNCLGLAPERAFGEISPRVAGLWTDDAGIVETRMDQFHAQRVRSVQRASAPGCLYFGGVAFKYQRPVADERLDAACRAAAPYVDVVTTSGPGTGRAAGLGKIRAMKTALGDSPLAIASGITPENVGDYLPWADSFLVATGIGLSHSELDPVRVADLVRRVRAYAG